MIDKRLSGRLWNSLAHLGCAAVLNVPFVLCHPGSTLVECPVVRAAIVSAVLLLVPGTAWVGVMIGRGWPRRAGVLWAVAASILSLVAVLLVVRLAGLTICGSTVWNGVWLLTNLGIVTGALLGGPPPWGLTPVERFDWLGVPLFLAAYALFFFGATRVVPPMEDQDFDVLGCGYALVTRFEPLLVSDHETVYQFSHPPLSYLWTAGSFLYFDKLDYLAAYDAPSRRALAARRGKEFRPYEGTVGGLSKGTGEHRVLRVEGTDYIVDPPLADGSRRIPVWEYENGVIAQHYEQDPQKLPARAANVFLSALTVALLGCWVGRMSGRWWLGVLVAVVYATSPEIFVRSAYGGHFSASNFAVLMVLMVVGPDTVDRRRSWWAVCLMAGGLAALVNHKLILLPLAVVLWDVLRRIQARNSPMAAVLHPVALGFAAGTLLFWSWGLAINPADFFRDHLMTHYLDRLVHHNPLGYGGYPSVLQLWDELFRHTGYLLLPLGLGALLSGSLLSGSLLSGSCERGKEGEAAASFASRARLWLLYVALTAVVFSVVDWRQTKHLMPLLIPLCAAPACWAVCGRTIRLAAVSLLFCVLAAWNGYSLYGLAMDFSAFTITPIW